MSPPSSLQSLSHSIGGLALLGGLIKPCSHLVQINQFSKTTKAEDAQA